MIYWLIGWFIDWFIDWLIDWLIDRFIDLFIDFTLAIDINECNNKSICSVGSCVNTEGTYKCMCDQGYKMEDKKCVVDDTKECKEGYELSNDGKCVGKIDCFY